jgi:hypothetical protein
VQGASAHLEAEALRREELRREQRLEALLMACELKGAVLERRRLLEAALHESLMDAAQEARLLL